ncbi:hypothetical protein M8J76_012505 [Diaphorina citri]|nr:hypothetical protein M8J76_012505 [Diaphorina citri]
MSSQTNGTPGVQGTPPTTQVTPSLPSDPVNGSTQMVPIVVDVASNVATVSAAVGWYFRLCYRFDCCRW